MEGGREGGVIGHRYGKKYNLASTLDCGRLHGHLNS